MANPKIENFESLKRVILSLREAAKSVASQPEQSTINHELVDFVVGIFEENVLVLSDLLSLLEAEVSREEDFEKLKQRIEPTKTPGTFAQWGGIRND